MMTQRMISAVEAAAYAHEYHGICEQFAYFKELVITGKIHDMSKEFKEYMAKSANRLMDRLHWILTRFPELHEQSAQVIIEIEMRNASR